MVLIKKLHAPREAACLAASIVQVSCPRKLTMQTQSGHQRHNKGVHRTLWNNGLPEDTSSFAGGHSSTSFATPFHNSANPSIQHGCCWVVICLLFINTHASSMCQSLAENQARSMSGVCRGCSDQHQPAHDLGWRSHRLHTSGLLSNSSA